MSEEEKIQLEAKLKEAQELAAVKAQNEANLVEELKQEREKKRLAQEELERVKGEKNQNPDAPDPEELVKRVLDRKEQESAKEAYTRALEDFKRTHNEFSPETDTAGLAFSKFEKELSKFNLTGLKTREEFESRLKEVYDFSSRKSTSDKPNFYKGTPPVGSEPQGNDNGNLSDTEAKLVNDMGWTKERYLKIKEKRPTYVAQLLNFRK